MPDHADNPRSEPPPDYDDEAEITQWRGPEILFGLAWDRIHPGQSVLDVGIGTGLAAVQYAKAGLHVHGLDISESMAAACRKKGLGDVTLHDMDKTPWPFADASMDHCVCAGTLSTRTDLDVVFHEAARIIRPGGTFAFSLARREDDEPAELTLPAEPTGSGRAVTVIRRSTVEVEALLRKAGLDPAKHVMFETLMSRRGNHMLAKAAWLSVKP